MFKKTRCKYHALTYGGAFDVGLEMFVCVIDELNDSTLNSLIQTSIQGKLLHVYSAAYVPRW